MPDADLRGRFVIAIAPPTLQWATDQMVEALGPETLKKLKVHAGEHLAAMLTTAFLRTPPMAIDTAGGADLWFDLSSSPRPGLKPASILTDGAAAAAFEIKSMPGPSREFNSGIDRDLARGNDTTGRSLEIRVQAASEVLRDMGPVLRSAGDQLHRKTNDETSRNIFVVIHLFDYFASECMQPILGHCLIRCPISTVSTPSGCSGHWSISLSGRTRGVPGLTCSSMR